jgi:hypothetical protein
VSHVALLVLVGCGVGVLVIHRCPSGITLRREEIDYFGRRLPWHQVGAMDVMATQYGSYLRLYRTPPVTVALLFLRPRPVIYPPGGCGNGGTAGVHPATVQTPVLGRRSG